MAKPGTKSTIRHTKSAEPEEKPPIAVSASADIARDLGGKSPLDIEDLAEISRVSVPIDAKTGKIAFDRMRPATREQFLRTLSVSGVATGENGSGTDSATDAALTDLLYQALGTVAAMGARARGFSPEDANVLHYTQAERDALRAPTLRVLSKYNLMSGKYADEIALALMLATITASKVQALVQLSASRETSTAAHTIAADGTLTPAGAPA